MRTTLMRPMAGLVLGVSFGVVAIAAMDAIPSASEALQRFRRRGYSGGYGAPPEVPIDNLEYNGRFTFNRIKFTPRYWGGGPYMWGLNLYWNHDYPRAERNLMQILNSVTALEPNLGGGNIYGLDDPELFKYPWAYICEVGYWTMTDEEAENLRSYLLKGGFLIVDDFGGGDYYQFEAMMQRALPGAKLEILDTTHPIFTSFFSIKPEDILNQYYNNRRGAPVVFGIYEDNDPSKRLLVVANYNQDIGESWEFSDTGYIPIELSNNSYKLGVNYIIYGMTH